MPIYGHQQVLETLGGEKGKLPPVSLFLGPQSVGKWATAEYLRGRWKVEASDLLRVRVLTMERARHLVRFAGVAPSGLSGRLAIVQLDKATPAALNTLLKVMESSPPQMRFILIAETAPLETIISRSFVFNFKRLKSQEIESILLDRKFNPTEAKRFAELADGSVQRALDAAEGFESKPTVLAVLRAFRERDMHALDRLADHWSDEHTSLLAAWCHESITQRWRIFTEAESELPGKGLPLKILMALRADIRPRLVVRSSLMTILRGA